MKNRFNMNDNLAPLCATCVSLSFSGGGEGAGGRFLAVLGSFRLDYIRVRDWIRVRFSNFKPVTFPEPLFFMLVLGSWDEMGMCCDNVKPENENWKVVLVLNLVLVVQSKTPYYKRMSHAPYRQLRRLFQGKRFRWVYLVPQRDGEKQRK